MKTSILNSNITCTVIGWKGVLYESIKQGAKAVTPSVNSLFRKIESNVLENEPVSLP